MFYDRSQKTPFLPENKEFTKEIDILHHISPTHDGMSESTGNNI